MACDAGLSPGDLGMTPTRIADIRRNREIAALPAWKHAIVVDAVTRLDCFVAGLRVLHASVTDSHAIGVAFSVYLKIGIESGKLF